MTQRKLDRREALKRLAMGGAGAASLPLWIEKLNGLALGRSEKHAHGGAGTLPAAQSAEGAWKPKVFSAHQNETVVTLSELIIPQTDTAGAKAALVNQFVDAVLDDANPSERREFMRGLRWVDARSNELFGADFIKATAEQQTALLTILSSGKNKSLEDQIGVEFFNAIRSMTLTGYYTSEVGMREELGDDGNLFFETYPGCKHPEHKA